MKDVMMLRLTLVTVVVFLSFHEVTAKLKGDDCEGFLRKFSQRLRENDVDPANQGKSEIELLKACREAKNKDEQFCYYIGAMEISATKLVKEVIKPLSFSKPVEKICEDLKKKDSQMCELRYEKQIDWGTVDLKTLRVKELKKILSNWGEDCRGCAEKGDFIDMINMLKPLYHSEL